MYQNDNFLGETSNFKKVKAVWRSSGRPHCSLGDKRLAKNNGKLVFQVIAKRGVSEAIVAHHMGRPVTFLGLVYESCDPHIISIPGLFHKAQSMLSALFPRPHPSISQPIPANTGDE